MSATIISPTSTVPKAANNLRKIGVSVFPIAHQQKTPSTSWKRFQTALPTEAQIQQWFSDKPTNYGIATGAFSNLVVLDADDSKAVDYIEQNFPSPWTQTTARGKQFFYRHPGGVVPNKTHVNGVAIDVRGDGGYVVGPGSIHPSGATYTVEQAWTGTPKELPELPLHLLSEPFATKKEFSFPTRGDRSALIERGRAYLASIEPPTVGNGSDALTYRVCCRLVGSGANDIGLTIEEALPLLMEWQPDFDADWFQSKVVNALEYGRNEQAQAVSDNCNYCNGRVVVVPSENVWACVKCGKSVPGRKAMPPSSYAETATAPAQKTAKLYRTVEVFEKEIIPPTTPLVEGLVYTQDEIVGGIISFSKTSTV